MKTDNPISSIMTGRVISIIKETKIKEIQEVFETHKIHHLPVIDKGQKVVGIISKTDILLFLQKLSLKTSGKTYSNLEMNSLSAKDIMTPEPLVLDPDDTVGLAADIFLTNDLHAAPVVEDNMLVGIITSHDLLKYAFQNKTVSNSLERVEPEIGE